MFASDAIASNWQEGRCLHTELSSLESKRTYPFSLFRPVSYCIFKMHDSHAIYNCSESDRTGTLLLLMMAFYVLQGPKLRVDVFEHDKVTILQGQQFRCVTQPEKTTCKTCRRCTISAWHHFAVLMQSRGELVQRDTHNHMWHEDHSVCCPGTCNSFSTTIMMAAR